MSTATGWNLYERKWDGMKTKQQSERFVKATAGMCLQCDEKNTGETRTTQSSNSIPSRVTLSPYMQSVEIETGSHSHVQSPVFFSVYRFGERKRRCLSLLLKELLSTTISVVCFDFTHFFFSSIF